MRLSVCPYVSPFGHRSWRATPHWPMGSLMNDVQAGYQAVPLQRCSNKRNDTGYIGKWHFGRTWDVCRMWPAGQRRQGLQFWKATNVPTFTIICVTMTTMTQKEKFGTAIDHFKQTDAAITISEKESLCRGHHLDDAFLWLQPHAPYH